MLGFYLAASAALRLIQSVTIGGDGWMRSISRLRVLCSNEGVLDTFLRPFTVSKYHTKLANMSFVRFGEILDLTAAAVIFYFLFYRYVIGSSTPR